MTVGQLKMIIQTYSDEVEVMVALNTNDGAIEEAATVTEVVRVYFDKETDELEFAKDDTHDTNDVMMFIS